MAGRNFNRRHVTVHSYRTNLVEKYVILERLHQEWQVMMFAGWEQNAEMVNWCKETFGTPGRSRKHQWRILYDTYNPHTIFLRKESDVTLFRLRWM